MIVKALRVGLGQLIVFGDWISRPAKRKRDAFLWMHCFDAHMAYEAPALFLQKHVRSAYFVPQTVREQMDERGWFSPDFPEYEWRVPLDHFPQRYRAAVAYQDHCLGEFVAALKKARLWDDALVMVTADHGECLMGDHDVYCAHKKLFDTTVRVPLRVKFPGGRFAGRVVDEILGAVRREGDQALLSYTRTLDHLAVRSVAELDHALRAAGRPVMLDFYADWCVSCKEMERFTFTDPEVARAMAGAVLLKADVTQNNADDRELLKRFSLFGPPGTIFFDAQGRELDALRVVGFQDAARFLKTLRAAGL